MSGTVVLRLKILVCVVGLLGIFIWSWSAYIYIGEHEELLEKLNRRTFDTINLVPSRGDILARDMRLLSTSYPLYDIHIDTKASKLSTENFQDSVELLVEYIKDFLPKLYKSDFAERLIKAHLSQNQYYLLFRKVDYQTLQVLRQFPLLRQSPMRGGMILHYNEVRQHTTGNLASRTLGYLTQSDYKNIPGLEGAFDEILKGQIGVGVRKKVNGGVYIPLIGQNLVDPIPGNDVLSTIDINLQDLADNALRKALKHHNADHGTAIILDVKTAEVRAIANLTKQADNSYAEVLNYALNEAIEPGSTFKIFSYLVAFEDGSVTPETILPYNPPTVKFFDKVIHDDYRKQTLGNLSVEEAFAYSSNVAVASLVHRLYGKKQTHFVDRLYQMNLNQKLNLQIQGEAAPLIKYPTDAINNHWSGISLVQMAYGYELKLSPIQILAYYNAIANDGKLLRPRFVTEVLHHGSPLKTFKPEVIVSSIASSQSIKYAQQLLKSVVKYGTAKHIHSPFYTIAGKTGTAQIAIQNQGYGSKNARKYYASFVGYFPAENPKYSCIVSIYNPTENGYGGSQVAAPVFKEIADKIYATDPYFRTIASENQSKELQVPFSKSGSEKDLLTVLNRLNIPYLNNAPNATFVTTASSTKELKMLPIHTPKNRVPNVCDMAIKDAIFLLEKQGLSVSFNGRGTVIAQSLSPGTEVIKNQNITLVLSQPE